MVKYKEWIFVFLILFFLLFSFSPTIFELSQRNNLADKNREFILEHNYYWPDYNLYLSKIRQGFEGSIRAQEKYTSEIHAGSMIQEFYVILGHLGRFLGLVPNYSYLLGRIILAPLLLLVILKLVKYYFPSQVTRVRPLTPLRSDPIVWQILAFLIVIVSGSFPRIWFDQTGAIQIGRYMEWWSNIDALQRITFIPHILFGQVVSFYLLYQLVTRVRPLTPLRSDPKLIFYIILGNLAGLVFPPSLITLNGVLILILFIRILGFKKQDEIFEDRIRNHSGTPGYKSDLYNTSTSNHEQSSTGIIRFLRSRKFYLRVKPLTIFIIFSLPSLLYIFLLTKQLPWSALVDFHRTHPMMIPLDQYVLGTGPIMILGFLGAIVSIVKRDRIYQPLILWVTVTLSMASFFSIVRDQSPLRFTQTGLYIPLGILGAYFFYHLFHLSYLSHLGNLGRRLLKTGVLLLICLYLLTSLFMMRVSLDWQTNWLKQLIGASIPAVPYPPQSVFPLKDWMDGIRWLRDNTNHNDVVLAEITAGNYIPAYSGNTVYFGQANTVDYERKQQEVDRFFSGKMSQREAELFLTSGRIKYVFSGPQEKKPLYSFLKPVYSNKIVSIYLF